MILNRLKQNLLRNNFLKILKANIFNKRIYKHKNTKDNQNAINSEHVIFPYIFKISNKKQNIIKSQTTLAYKPTKTLILIVSNLKIKS